MKLKKVPLFELKKVTEWISYSSWFLFSVSVYFIPDLNYSFYVVKQQFFLVFLFKKNKIIRIETETETLKYKEIVRL